MSYPVIDMIGSGKRIKEVMKEQKKSAREIADYMGFETPKAVYKWLWGQSLPSLDNFFALCIYLGKDIGDLLVRQGNGEWPSNMREQVEAR